MEASAREGLLVDGARAPLAEEDSGSVELLDGTRFTYRAIAPDNAAGLQRFHHRLTERSVYLRFFGATPELSDRKAGYFTNVDGMNRFALVALDPERPEEIIAVVSFDREGTTDRAEYAAAVEDRWQGNGLGLALTRRLIEAALKRYQGLHRRSAALERPHAQPAQGPEAAREVALRERCRVRRDRASARQLEPRLPRKPSTEE
jgi:GNAT superfamily N-acetyltransferase